MGKIKQYPPYVADKLPPDVLQEIGLVIVKWNLVDLHLGRIITHGFGLPFITGRTLTFSMTTNTKIKIIKILTGSANWIKDKKLRNNIKIFVKKVEKYAKKRNNFAHGIFGWDLEGPDIFYRYLTNECPDFPGKLPAEEIHIDELRDIVNDISSFIVGAINLTNKLIQAPYKKTT